MVDAAAHSRATNATAATSAGKPSTTATHPAADNSADTTHLNRRAAAAAPSKATRSADVPAITRDAAERGLKAAADAWLETHGGRGSHMAFDAQTGSLLTFIVLFAVLLMMRRRRRKRDEYDEERSSSSPKGTPAKDKSRRTWPATGRLREWIARAGRSVLPIAIVLLPWRIVRRWLHGSTRRKSDEDGGATELEEMGTGGSQHGGARIMSGGVGGISGGGGSEVSPVLTADCMQVFAVPQLLASTSQPPTVLSSDALIELRNALPLRYRPCDWALLYSTDQHGCSLRTFYSRLERRGGTILLVLDALGHTFGAFVSEDWRPTEGQTSVKYFGNGETFVFRFQPSFERYGWTRANDHFVLSAPECVAFGGGAHFALYLDSELECGSSHPSPTFGNPCLAGSEQFKCIKCEVWGFV